MDTRSGRMGKEVLGYAVSYCCTVFIQQHFGEAIRPGTDGSIFVPPEGTPVDRIYQ